MKLEIEYFSKILAELVIAQAMEMKSVRFAVPLDFPISHLIHYEKALQEIQELGYQMRVITDEVPALIGAVVIHLPRRKH